MVSIPYFSTSERRHTQHRPSPYSAIYSESHRVLARGGYVPGIINNNNNSRSNSNARNDEPTSQREKIAVACGRCRKRKIRCSGDKGSGEPCTNCKSVGEGVCQFLRLQASEAAYIVDVPDFHYNLERSRQYQARGLSNIYGPVSYVNSQQTMLRSQHRGDNLVPSPTTAMDAFSYRNASNHGYANTEGPRNDLPLATGGYYAPSHTEPTTTDLGYRYGNAVYPLGIQQTEETSYASVAFSYRQLSAAAMAPHHNRRVFSNTHHTTYGSYSGTVGAILATTTTTAPLGHRPVVRGVRVLPPVRPSSRYAGPSESASDRLSSYNFHNVITQIDIINRTTTPTVRTTPATTTTTTKAEDDRTNVISNQGSMNHHHRTAAHASFRGGSVSPLDICTSQSSTTASSVAQMTPTSSYASYPSSPVVAAATTTTTGQQQYSTVPVPASSRQDERARGQAGSSTALNAPRAGTPTTTASRCEEDRV